MLGALIPCSLGLLLMRLEHPLRWASMFFINLPLVMLGLVTAMRGPFLTFAPALVPPDGQGLNPLLQDPWMTIHPPVLFTGFSSLAVPFAIAMAALVKRDYDGWVKVVLPWVLLSTGVLATGFIMGGVWAYKVLGWGGYWGWDPVENGSLFFLRSDIRPLPRPLVPPVTGAPRAAEFFPPLPSDLLACVPSLLHPTTVLSTLLGL